MGFGFFPASPHPSWKPTSPQWTGGRARRQKQTKGMSAATVPVVSPPGEGQKTSKGTRQVIIRLKRKREDAPEEALLVGNRSLLDKKAASMSSIQRAMKAASLNRSTSAKVFRLVGTVGATEQVSSAKLLTGISEARRKRGEKRVLKDTKGSFTQERTRVIQQQRVEQSRHKQLWSKRTAKNDQTDRNEELGEDVGVNGDFHVIQLEKVWADGEGVHRSKRIRLRKEEPKAPVPIARAGPQSVDEISGRFAEIEQLKALRASTAAATAPTAEVLGNGAGVKRAKGWREKMNNQRAHQQKQALESDLEKLVTADAQTTTIASTSQHLQQQQCLQRNAPSRKQRTAEQDHPYASLLKDYFDTVASCNDASGAPPGGSSGNGSTEKSNMRKQVMEWAQNTTEDDNNFGGSDALPSSENGKEEYVYDLYYLDDEEVEEGGGGQQMHP